MATNGVLPNCLADFTFTVYAACLYVKATKRPCKTKTARSINEYKPVSSVRDCVSIYVLVSSTTGLIAHIYGFITRQSYHYACVFVDHHSDFTYVNLLTSQTGNQSVGAKEDSEAYAESHGVYIKHYYADNENYRSERWMNHRKEIHQGLTFSEVNYHHQNGRSERHIRSLQDLVHCQIIHSNHICPSAITCGLANSIMQPISSMEPLSVVLIIHPHLYQRLVN